MRIPDQALEHLREVGFVVVPGVVSGPELAAAQDALWSVYPRPDDYFADPDAYRWVAKGQFAGLREGPFGEWALNRLCLHPDLIDAAERFLGTTDLELYKTELWGKYAGATDYEQGHHRDFGNHSLVVPRRDGRWPQLTTFVLLSDVTDQDGPTALVPRPLGDPKPLKVGWMEAGSFADDEVLATGPAGSVVLYQTDVLHRGTDFGGPGRSRFMLLADFQARGASWAGKVAWPNKAMHPGFGEMMVRASVRERDLFGWPRPGDEYWNDQTIADVARRYPGIDLSPYAEAMAPAGTTPAEPAPGPRLETARPRIGTRGELTIRATRWARGRFHRLRRRIGL
ncbi:MAG: phytanoyl-CoA dioxygenase family protein [Acidimicrobiia bacterium]|nr:phytanoyl-CoA dioxygenase family protein [Acidimicrobiia bacterium]